MNSSLGTAHTYAIHSSSISLQLGLVLSLSMQHHHKGHKAQCEHQCETYIFGKIQKILLNLTEMVEQLENETSVRNTYKERKY